MNTPDIRTAIMYAILTVMRTGIEMPCMAIREAVASLLGAELTRLYFPFALGTLAHKGHVLPCDRKGCWRINPEVAKTVNQEVSAATPQAIELQGLMEKQTGAGGQAGAGGDAPEIEAGQPIYLARKASNIVLISPN